MAEQRDGVVVYNGRDGKVFRVKYRDATGRQVMETVGTAATGMTRAKAAKIRRERVVKVEQKGWRKPAPLSFGQYADRWFAEGEVKRGWKPNTIKEYVSVKRRLVDAFGPIPLAAVRPRDVAAFVREHNGAPASIAKDLAVLSAVFKSARAEELVEANPAEGAERPKIPRRRWRILEPAEARRVAAAFSDEQDRVVFLTLVLLGIRRHELQAARWQDLNLLEGVWRIPNSKSEAGERSVAIPLPLLELLKTHYTRTPYKGDEQLVFCHPEKGSVYRYTVFREALTAALAAAGVDAKLRPFHDLRHASLTNGAAAGESPIALMTRAGHASMSTTRAYLHLAGTVFHDEAAALAERMLGSTSSSTNLSTPGMISGDAASLNQAENGLSDTL
jgi:integrase